MKINGVNNGVKIYSSNSIYTKNTKTIEKKDKIEISQVGKFLNDFSIKYNEEERVKKVEEIKKNIDNGTYKIDSKVLSDRILKYIGEKNYDN